MQVAKEVRRTVTNRDIPLEEFRLTSKKKRDENWMLGQKQIWGMLAKRQKQNE